MKSFRFYWNQVKFDAAKESFLILSREDWVGDPINRRVSAAVDGIDNFYKLQQLQHAGGRTTRVTPVKKPAGDASQMWVELLRFCYGWSEFSRL